MSPQEGGACDIQAGSVRTQRHLEGICGAGNRDNVKRSFSFLISYTNSVKIRQVSNVLARFFVSGPREHAVLYFNT